jgi:hypothetical protein
MGKLVLPQGVLYGSVPTRQGLVGRGEKVRQCCKLLLFAVISAYRKSSAMRVPQRTLLPL